MPSVRRSKRNNAVKTEKAALTGVAPEEPSNISIDSGLDDGSEKPPPKRRRIRNEEVPADIEPEKSVSKENRKSGKSPIKSEPVGVNPSESGRTTPLEKSGKEKHTGKDGSRNGKARVEEGEDSSEKNGKILKKRKAAQGGPPESSVGLERSPRRATRRPRVKEEPQEDFEGPEDPGDDDYEEKNLPKANKKLRSRAKKEPGSSGSSEPKRLAKARVQRKTFTKPKFQETLGTTGGTNDSLEFSKYERRIVDIIKSMADSDDSDLEEAAVSGDESSQQSASKKAAEDVKGTAQVEDVDILKLLKENEDVEEMDCDSSDEEAPKAPVKPESGGAKHTDPDVRDEELKGGASKRRGKKTAPQEAKPGGTKRKKKGQPQSSPDQSSDDDEDGEDDWQVVANAADYKRPEEVTVFLQKEDLVPESRRLSAKQMMIRMINRKRKRIGFLQHRVHLLSLVAHQQYVNSVLRNEELKGRALSLLPIAFISSNGCLTNKSLTDFLKYLKSAFGALNTSDGVFRPGSLKKDLGLLFEKGEVSCNIALSLGVAMLLQAARFRCRLCLNLQVLSHKMTLLRLSDGELAQCKPKVSSTPRGVSDYFLEVLLPESRTWRPLDLEEFVVTQNPQEFGQGLEQPALYILSVDGDGKLRDLSPKYNSDWLNKLLRQRSDKAFLEKLLARFKPKEDEPNDQAEIEMLHKEEGLPKIIADYKNHPKYVLKRHLLKFEALYPEDTPIVGHVRKEPVYSRECVKTLRSKDTWHRFGRQVKEGETSYNIVKARPKWDKKTETLIKDLPLEVFGEWQTEQFVPPVVEDGKIPRNKYGNVELFHECMLPIGTVHLKLPGLQKIADELGVDCVPAVVGFEGVHRGLHPVVEGFVVCAEHQQMLEEAWDERKNEDHRKRRERIIKRAQKNWRRVIKKVLCDLRIKKKYKNQL